jgi:hypothetical protein
MRHSILLFAFLSLLLLVPTGCGSSAPLPNGGNLLTLTNLRNRGNQLTSINEWRGRTIIPACTPVLVTMARGREIRFSAGGTQYRYVIHRTSRLPVETHLAHYFGTDCPKLDQMSAVDQMGVQTGIPTIGMSRAGVVIAAGYPPEHRTPSLDQPAWTFWGDPGRVVVHFQGDAVAFVEGLGNVPPPQAQALPAGTATNTTGGQVTHTAQPANQTEGGGGIDIVEHGEGGHEVVEQ